MLNTKGLNSKEVMLGKLQAYTVKGWFILILLFTYSCNRSPEAYISPLGEVAHPTDNPNSPEKIELGRKLFFDKRLSLDETVSCASCHIPEFAFTDRKKVSNGINGRITARNSPSILNAGYLKTIMFDAHVPTLEMQVEAPLQEHAEMGIAFGKLLERLQKIPEYQNAAQKIYQRDFDAWVLTRSIAAFERSLISDNSKFDQYMYQNKKSSLNKSEKAGWKIFSEKLYCTKCHPAPHFTTYVAENNGLYLDYGEDKGRFRIHHDSTDIGKFKVPSLRNASLTFPYMHDGSIRTLEDVIEHYSKGGSGNENQNKVITSFNLTKNEKRDLILFLNTLTDASYMENFR